MLDNRRQRQSVSATQLRENISEHIGRVRHGRERLVIEKNSKPAAALISYKDLELLEALEDRLDILLAERVLAQNGPRVSLEDAEKLLGL